MNFEKNDIVHSEDFGYGTVDKIDKHPKYPIVIKWENAALNTSNNYTMYTVEGYYFTVNDSLRGGRKADIKLYKLHEL